MSQFVFFAVLLGLLAVAFAISALWQSSRRLALALVLGLPLAAAGLYYLKGTPAAFQPPVHAVEPKTMDEAIAQLKARLAAEPNNFDGRVLLARSYMAMEKFDLARDSFAEAYALQPDNADLAVEYAEALLRASPDHRFPPKAVELIEDTVKKNPQNQRGLFFLGLHQMESNQPADAAATWQSLLPLVAPETAVELRKEIDKARIAANLSPLPELAVASGPSLKITVQIDPTLANLAVPGDTLFVFARSADGGGPPVAVKRLPFDKLPIEVTLTDADSPMPAGKLSSQKTVTVMARLSKSGTALPGSGDIEADPVSVTLADAKPINLMLSRAIP
jgi:cytochrome c-type biogenesis protein CcmH